MREMKLYVSFWDIKMWKQHGMDPEATLIKYAGIYQNFFKLVDAKCMDDNMEALADEVDVIFTATPQGLCASLVNEGILSRTKVIDLSADFRLKDVKVYEEWNGGYSILPFFF